MATLPGSRYDEPWRGIPAEIRRTIWAYSVSLPGSTAIVTTKDTVCQGYDDYGQQLYDMYPMTCVNSHRGLGSINASLLRANREIHNEASHMLYSQLVFLLDDTCDNIIGFLNRLNPVDLRSIRYIHLSRSCTIHDDTTNHSYNDVARIMTERMELISVTFPIKSERKYYISWFKALAEGLFNGRLLELRLEYEQESGQGQSQQPRHANDDADHEDNAEVSADMTDLESDDQMLEETAEVKSLYEAWEKLSRDQTCAQLDRDHYASLHDFFGWQEMTARGEFRCGRQRAHRLLYPFRLTLEKEGGSMIVLRADVEAAELEMARLERSLRDEDARKAVVDEAARLKYTSAVDQTVWRDRARKALDEFKARVREVEKTRARQPKTYEQEKAQRESVMALQRLELADAPLETIQ